MSVVDDNMDSLSTNLVNISVVCMEWGKRHKGTAVGIISFSESIGSTLFSIIGTAVINPRNLPVDQISGYFEEPEILHRIPIYFLALGVATFIVLIPTSLVISMPQGSRELMFPQVNSYFL